MLLVLFALIVVENVKVYKAKLEDEQWSSSIDHAPTWVWDSEGKYACFLSHYKMECASDCRYLHDVLQRML